MILIALSLAGIIVGLYSIIGEH